MWHRQTITSGQHSVQTYRAGSGDTTLLLIHGGPGAGSGTLRETHHPKQLGLDMQVVTWDQLGCGESPCEHDDSLWSIERFTQECTDVIIQLNLKHVILLGRSWGGVIAQEYVLKNPNAVEALILGGSSCDMALMQVGFEHCKNALGLEFREMMHRRETAGTTDHPEYRAAVTLLSYRHVCRLETWPESLTTAISTPQAKRAMEILFGKYFFNCTGVLQAYDRSVALKKIKLPALIMHGEHDYISLACATRLHESLSNSVLTILKGCSHFSYLEDFDQYQQILKRFLKGLPKAQIKS